MSARQQNDNIPIDVDSLLDVDETQPVHRKPKIDNPTSPIDVDAVSPITLSLPANSLDPINIDIFPFPHLPSHSSSPTVTARKTANPTTVISLIDDDEGGQADFHRNSDGKRTLQANKENDRTNEPAQKRQKRSSFSCPICLDDEVSETEFFDGLSCEHKTCKTCILNMIVVVANDTKKFPITCVLCPQTIENEKCLVLLKQHKKVTEHDLLQTLIIQKTQFKNLVYCSNPKCSTPLDYENEECSSSTYMKCPLCQFETCTECKTPWHHNQTCSDHQLQSEFKQLAQANNWTQCPACGHATERNLGSCFFVTCKCGCAFCHNCGKPYISTARFSNNHNNGANAGPRNHHGIPSCDCGLSSRGYRRRFENAALQNNLYFRMNEVANVDHQWKRATISSNRAARRRARLDELQREILADLQNRNIPRTHTIATTNNNIANNNNENVDAKTNTSHRRERINGPPRRNGARPANVGLAQLDPGYFEELRVNQLRKFTERIERRDRNAEAPRESRPIYNYSTRQPRDNRVHHVRFANNVQEIPNANGLIDLVEDPFQTENRQPFNINNLTPPGSPKAQMNTMHRQQQEITGEVLRPSNAINNSRAFTMSTAGSGFTPPTIATTSNRPRLPQHNVNNRLWNKRSSILDRFSGSLTQPLSQRTQPQHQLYPLEFLPPPQTASATPKIERNPRTSSMRLEQAFNQHILNPFNDPIPTERHQRSQLHPLHPPFLNSVNGMPSTQPPPQLFQSPPNEPQIDVMVPQVNLLDEITVQGHYNRNDTTANSIAGGSNWLNAGFMSTRIPTTNDHTNASASNIRHHRINNSNSNTAAKHNPDRLFDDHLNRLFPPPPPPFM